MGIRICIELDEKDYRDLTEMFPGRRVEELVKDMVTNNIKNYRELMGWVERIIKEEVEKGESS